MKCFPCFGSSSDGDKEDSEDSGRKSADKTTSGDDAILEEPNVQVFTFCQIQMMTLGFRPQDCIGTGGFGNVYRGQLPGTGQEVAIKRHVVDRQGNREFLVELFMLSILHHPNLINLVGYCAQGHERIIVYEYLPLGPLDDLLHDVPKDAALDWTTRMKIALGAAQGLEYMHEKAFPPVIYRDLKSSNILLDSGYFPKLSDFGLAKLGPTGDDSYVFTRVMGTYGYCAPEYALTCQLTLQSDVYSFGVVLLEIITGRRALDKTKIRAEQDLVTWARPRFKDYSRFEEMADPQLGGRYPKRGLYQAIVVAAMCVQEQAARRPSIGDVVTALTYLCIAAENYDPNKPDPGSRAGPRRVILSYISDAGFLSSSYERSSDLQGSEKSDLQGSESEKSDLQGREKTGAGWSSSEPDEDEDDGTGLRPRSASRARERLIRNADVERERSAAEVKEWAERMRREDGGGDDGDGVA